MGDNNMLDTGQSSLLLGRNGPTTIRSIFRPRQFLSGRVFLSQTYELRFGLFALFGREVVERFLGVRGFKVGLTVTRFETEMEKMGEQAVDVLLSRMGRRRVDKDQRGVGVRRRLEEVRICALERHKTGVLTQNARYVCGKLRSILGRVTSSVSDSAGVADSHPQPEQRITRCADRLSTTAFNGHGQLPCFVVATRPSKGVTTFLAQRLTSKS